MRKLDPGLRESWELSEEDPNSDPSVLQVSTYDSLVKFLEKRIQTFEHTSSESIPEVKPNLKRPHPDSSRKTQACNSNNTLTAAKRPRFNNTNGSSIRKCLRCQGPHYLSACEQFLKLSPSDRLSAARLCKACLNCLGGSHFVASCPSSRSCLICHKKHHSLLHFDSDINSVTQRTSTNTIPRSSSKNTKSGKQNPSASSHCTSIGTSRLLATARVILQSGDRSTTAMES